jgi:hypothetical protein
MLQQIIGDGEGGACLLRPHGGIDAPPSDPCGCGFSQQACFIAEALPVAVRFHAAYRAFRAAVATRDEMRRVAHAAQQTRQRNRGGCFAGAPCSDVTDADDGEWRALRRGKGAVVSSSDTVEEGQRLQQAAENAARLPESWCTHHAAPSRWSIS